MKEPSSSLYQPQHTPSNKTDRGGTWLCGNGQARPTLQGQEQPACGTERGAFSHPFVNPLLSAYSGPTALLGTGGD